MSISFANANGYFSFVNIRAGGAEEFGVTWAVITPPSGVVGDSSNPRGWDIIGQTVKHPSFGGATPATSLLYADTTAGEVISGYNYFVNGVNPATGGGPIGNGVFGFTQVSLTGASTACTGDSVTLTYATSGAASASTTGLGSITANTSATATVGPLTAGTHVYSVTAVDPVTGASITASHTITVADCGGGGSGGTNTCTATGLLAFIPPVIDVECSLVAVPPSLLKGETSTLLLTTQNALRASLDNGLGPVLLTNGSAAQGVSPAMTTTYAAVAEGAWLTQARAQASVTVMRPVVSQTCACAWTPQTSPTSPGWNKTGC